MLTNEIKNHLQKSRPFHYLAAAELEMLLAYSQDLLFSPGEILLQQGKVGEGMFIIMEGNALVTAKILGKGLIEIAMLNHDDFIGEASLMEEVPSAISVTASTRLHCLLIKSSYFKMLATFFPELRFKISKAIIEVVCVRLQNAHNRIISIMANSDIAPKSIFGDIIQSFSKPHITTFQESQITPDFLNRLQYFENLNLDEVNEFLRYTTLIQATNKCTLIKQGEKDSVFFLVIKGAVQSNITQDNKAAKIAVLGPASIFGNITYIDHETSILSYISCERVILLKIESSELNLLQKNNIFLWYKIYDIICKSFVSLERSIEKLYIRLNIELYNR